MRPRISAAAFRVNVMARMFVGSTPLLNRLRYRSTSTCVLPVPADASSTTLCAGSTARCRAAASGTSAKGSDPFFSLNSVALGEKMGSDPFSSNGNQSDVANVILPADGGVRATGAHHGVRRRRRKFTTLDPVDRIQQPRLRVDQGRVSGLPARQHRDELAILSKGDVTSLAWLPVLASSLPQMLHRADGVDRQLQRQFAIGRATQLVIDDAECVVLQQIDA